MTQQSHPFLTVRSQAARIRHPIAENFVTVKYKAMPSIMQLHKHSVSNVLKT